MLKRSFDIVVSFIGLVLISPLLLLIALLILLDDGFPVFYLQKRVGLHNKDFTIYKFRTMRVGADKKGLLTVGDKDPRVTRVGYYLRKYKLDELPQLFNVLVGDMSMVGPRPEVRKYVEMYSEEQKRVLNVKPGITDYASIAFISENEMLAQANNPEELYVKHVMPEKLKLNLAYIQRQSFYEDLKILIMTLIKIGRRD